MKYLFLLLSISLFVSCSQQEKNPDPRLEEKEVPVDFDIGVAKDGVFTNNYFGLSFKYNEDWDIQSDEEMQKLLKIGSEMASGSAPTDEQFKAEQIRSAQHFTAFKYKFGSDVDYNPNIMVTSENVKGFGIVYGDQYLESVRDMWPNTQVDIDQVGVIKEEKIGGKDFFILEAKMTLQGFSFSQKYYCTIVKDFALAVIITYNSEEQENELKEIINSFSFK